MYTRSQYQALVDQQSGVTFTLNALQDMGVVVPSYIEIESQYSYTSGQEQWFSMFDFNDDGVRDIVYLARDVRDGSWYVFVEMSDGASWLQHSLQLPRVHGVFPPSVSLAGASVQVDYTVSLDDMDPLAVGGGWMGNTTHVTLQSSIMPEPRVTSVDASFARGDYGYSQFIDLEHQLYRREWTSESIEGGVSETSIEKLPALKREITSEAILWSDFSSNSLQDVFGIAESE